MRDQIEGVLEKFRPGFQADGADLALGNVDGGNVEVKLLVGPNTCEECMLPPDQLEKMFEMSIKQSVATVQSVKVVREEALT
ncbi:MAG: NifU family protein [Chloroflexi bacterium]|nr:NifU family protein [Chloroflexota bacterium]